MLPKIGRRCVTLIVIEIGVWEAGGSMVPLLYGLFGPFYCKMAAGLERGPQAEEEQKPNFFYLPLHELVLTGLVTSLRERQFPIKTLYGKEILITSYPRGAYADAQVAA